MKKRILGNGLEVSGVGLGCMGLSHANGAPTEEREAVNILRSAYDIGYTFFDTAETYGYKQDPHHNEKLVGKAFSGMRSQVVIATKFGVSFDYTNEFHPGLLTDSKPETIRKSVEGSLERLGTDYIDLLLLHQQFGDYIGAWRDMEKAVKAGKVKSIGLSNFESDRLEEVLAIAEIKPSVLQVECHPYFQQNALKTRVKEYGTVLESWYPIRHGDKGLINEPVFTKLGKKMENQMYRLF